MTTGEPYDVVPCSSVAVDSILRIGTAGAIWGLCSAPHEARKQGEWSDCWCCRRGAIAAMTRSWTQITRFPFAADAHFNRYLTKDESLSIDTPSSSFEFWVKLNQMMKDNNSFSSRKHFETNQWSSAL
ncbi:Mitochondrial import inner membrane translocase subunit Tim17/Tim22/Tim23 family protein [Prunus dulcis]|uniref:Mitochondrial import inner membrane translocase subunit Tim17/Tim22/Tim23 family protein n=1 Tax=Prunus dulcis TaxID=3755 RepID=A0A4Y1S1J4_PRUDU|nr:Mitochondrial import inner membrane translocase subunit Tim17/Tim22/Tim23 family protein [Prunus dulcis]